MTAIRKRGETSVIGQIEDDLLAWVRPQSYVNTASLWNCNSRFPFVLNLLSIAQYPVVYKGYGAFKEFACTCVIIAVQRRRRGKDKNSVGNLLQ